MQGQGTQSVTRNQLRIDEEFARLIPPLTDEEYAGLERSILEEGVREPLITWQGVIVDGHNRYEIATAHGLDFETVEYDFPDRAAAIDWMVETQCGRRNLELFQKTALRIRADKAKLAAKAKERQRGGQGGVLLSVNSSEANERLDTRKELAKSAGVSEQTVSRVEHILNEAPPELIAQCERGDVSINAAYKQIRQAEREAKREAEREANAEKVAAIDNPLEAQGLFTTIVIDPPWDWGDEGDVNQMGRAKPDYSTMPIDDIAAMPVGDIAANDAHLYLWVTNRSLPKAFRLMEAWGFRYVTCITWAKPSFGMGNYFRGQTEQVLFGVKGSLMLKRRDASTLFEAPRGDGGHSSKPQAFYDFVESCSPGPYIDVFGRGGREGWTTWGQES